MTGRLILIDDATNDLFERACAIARGSGHADWYYPECLRSILEAYVLMLGNNDPETGTES